MRIGFLGLGNMGRAMASNLLKGGNKLRVWNCTPAVAAKLAGRGPRRSRHQPRPSMATWHSPCWPTTTPCARF